MNPIKEITIPVRFETTEEGHITSITFPEKLPVLALEYLLTFLSDLDRARTKSPSREIS